MDLDFKATCNLGDRAATVAIAKDIAAFSAQGGHIVIGVTEDGRPSNRFASTEVKLFDEASLRAKIAPRYLPLSVSITTATHDVEGSLVVVLYIAPHADGFVVMQGDGDHTDGHGNPCQDFRAGDVFVRRGSASVRWRQSEAATALERAVATRKEGWREGLRDDLAGLGLGVQAQQIARGPAANFTWQLDNDAFNATLVELLRAGDDIAITMCLDAMTREAGESVSRGDLDDLRTILDRAASVAAVGLGVRRSELLQQAVDALLRIYNLGFDSPWGPSVIRSADLWLEAITRVYAIGGLAVRRRNWPAVKTLTLQRGRGRDFDYYPNWLRHALTEAANAGALRVQDGDRHVELSLLQMAVEHIERLAALRPDIAVDSDAALDSLTQFDLLSIFTAIADANTTKTKVFYTNFARFNWSRSEPALVRLIEDQELRQILVPLESSELAVAIREVSRRAQSEAFRFSVWSGWDSTTVESFLLANP